MSLPERILIMSVTGFFFTEVVKTHRRTKRNNSITQVDKKAKELINIL